MKELLSLLKENSPGAALLIVIGSVIIFVIKLAVEKSIAIGFETHTNNAKRRSNFEDKVLTDRFEMIMSLETRLQKVMSNLNRMRSGQPAQEGFMDHNEIVPLTEIFEDLSVHRLILTEDFYVLLRKKAEFALHAANEWEEEEINREWNSLSNKLQRLMDRDFGLSKIRW
jgi:hypothetical protein